MHDRRGLRHESNAYYCGRSSVIVMGMQLDHVEAFVGDRALTFSTVRLAVPVVLVDRRRAFLSGAARAVIALLREA